MEWTLITEAVPEDAVLIFSEGGYYVAVIVDPTTDPAFMDVHSGDLLPWPSHWTKLPLPPSSGPGRPVHANLQGLQHFRQGGVGSLLAFGGPLRLLVRAAQVDRRQLLVALQIRVGIVG